MSTAPTSPSPHRWFCFDGETYSTFATAKEAQDEAENAIEGYRDRAPEGWAEEVIYVAWGEIIEAARETLIHEHDAMCRDEDGCRYSFDFDRHVDYYLAPLAPLDGEGGSS